MNVSNRRWWDVPIGILVVVVVFAIIHYGLAFWEWLSEKTNFASDFILICCFGVGLALLIIVGVVAVLRELRD